jgi:hypothetical protein
MSAKGTRNASNTCGTDAPCRQPTCELTQRVLRAPFHGMMTVSISSPSLSLRSSLVVESLDADTCESDATPPSSRPNFAG